LYEVNQKVFWTGVQIPPAPPEVLFKVICKGLTRL